MSQPDVVSASSASHGGLCLSYDIIFSSVLPSLLSWSAHSESIFLSSSTVPAQTLDPSRHLMMVIWTEMDFPYDWYVLAATGNLSPKGDLDQKSNRRMSKMYLVE